MKLNNRLENINKSPERDVIKTKKILENGYRKKQGKGDYKEIEKTILVSGEGFKAKEIADNLGVKYKTSDSPNTRVINKAIDNLEISESGTISNINTKYNNGGYGQYEFDIPLYSVEYIEIIKNEIENKAIKIKADLYDYDNIKFRL